MSNPDLELMIADLEGRLAVDRAKYDGLQLQQFRNDTAALQISSVHENILATEEALRLKRADLARLKLVAPIAGTVLPPPEQPSQAGQPRRSVAKLVWHAARGPQSGIVSHRKHPGLHGRAIRSRCRPTWCWINRRSISSPTGQSVDIKLDHLPLDEFQGKITTIALQDMKVTPKNLSNKSGGELASKTDESRRRASLEPVVSGPGLPAYGSRRLAAKRPARARAKIHARWQTAAERLALLGNTFNFRL